MATVDKFDYIVVLASLLITATIGFYYGYQGRKKKTVASYLLGDRNMNFIAVGISLVVTFFTAVLYTGVPAEGYILGIGFGFYASGMIGAGLITAFVFVPVLYPLKLTTSYDYLQRRFDSRSVRILGASIGLISGLLFNALTTYASAVAIASISEIPVMVSISVISALATVYTSLGGLKAVIWTDVFQYIIMISGMIAVLVMGTEKVGGVENMIKMCSLGGRINIPTLNPDPRIYFSLWSMVIGSTATTLANIGIQQMTVQRFNSIASISSARRSILVAIPGFVIFVLTASLMGVIVYSYYHSISCDPLASGQITSINQVVPYFVSNVLSQIPGMAGIFLAAICCSTLSTVSSMLNSLTAMIWDDMLRFCFGNISERSVTFLLKIIVLVLGAILVLLSFLMSKLPSTFARIGIAILGATGGPVLGLFILGLTVPQANWIGATTGIVVSLTVGSFVGFIALLLPPAPVLPPAPISGCVLPNISTTVNMTSAFMTLTSENLTFNIEDMNKDYPTIQDRVDVTGYMSLFRLSPTYYAIVGITVTFLVGIFVSLLTGPTNPSAVAPELLFPATRRFFSRWGSSSGKETGKDEEGELIQRKETVF